VLDPENKETFFPFFGAVKTFWPKSHPLAVSARESLALPNDLKKMQAKLVSLPRQGITYIFGKNDLIVSADHFLYACKYFPKNSIQALRHNKGHSIEDNTETILEVLYESLSQAQSLTCAP
jgi:gamma-glutamylcysteine synthetase